MQELGCSYTFSGRVDSALRDHRLQEGVARLKKLAMLQKAALIQTSIWPVCLHGLESHALPQYRFAQLRSLAARAMVGNHATMSPYLALSALTDRVQDPQAFCLARQLHALRRVADQDPGTAASLVATACAHPQARQAMGPSTALAIALRRVGLSMSVEGLVKGPDHVSVPLLEATKPDVDFVVSVTWAHHALAHVSHRCGLHNCYPSWPSGTGRTLDKLTESERHVLCRHICGGFSTEVAKSRWDPEVDGACPLCGDRDSRTHRLLHCPATEHVRSPWRSLID